MYMLHVHVVEMSENQMQAIKMLYETLIIVVCFVIINLIISEDTKTLIALPLQIRISHMYV